MTASTTTSHAAPQRPAAAPAPGRRVIDAPMRMFHWLFAATFAGAYLTAESEHWRLVHVTLGYTFAGLLGFRVLYGLFGPRHVRLSLLWRRVAGLPAWLRSIVAARSGPAVNWRQGQNLAMAAALVLMLALVAPLVLSGLGTYNEWGGGDWLEEMHEFFGNTFLAVVLAHLGLIAALSVLRRQNQALPMLTGRGQGTGPSLITHNRGWLAGLLLGAVVAFGAWQWWDAPKGEAAAAQQGAERGSVTPHRRGAHHDADRD